MAIDLQALAQQEGVVGERTILSPMSDLNTLHSDGDYAAYYYAGNDETPLGTAKENYLNALRVGATILGVPLNNITVHITDPMSDKGGRYRIGTVSDYQGKRTHSQRPKNWQGMRDWLHAGLPGAGVNVANWLDREADDGAAFASLTDVSFGRTPGIHSRDKDWRMFPGRHLRWTDLEVTDVPFDAFDVKDNEGNQYGHKFFWLQMLMGDSTDGVPGLERIAYVNNKGKDATKLCGEACALTVLDDADNNGDAYLRVAAAYEGYYGPAWPTYFAEQAMLLWMRNDPAAHPTNYMQVIPKLAHYDLTKANTFISKRIKK